MLGAVTPNIIRTKLLNSLFPPSASQTWLRCFALSEQLLVWNASTATIIDFVSEYAARLSTSDFTQDPDATFKQGQLVLSNDTESHFVFLIETVFSPVHLPILATGLLDLQQGPASAQVSLFTVSSSTGCHKSSIHSLQHHNHGLWRVAVSCDDVVYLMQVGSATKPLSRPTALQLATPQFFETVPVCANSLQVAVHQKGGLFAKGTCAGTGWGTAVRSGSNSLHLQGNSHIIVSDAVLSAEEVVHGNVSIVGQHAQTQTVEGVLVSYVAGWFADWREHAPAVIPVCIISDSVGEPSAVALDVREVRPLEFDVQFAIAYPTLSGVLIIGISNSQTAGLAGPKPWNLKPVAQIQLNSADHVRAMQFRRGLLYIGTPDSQNLHNNFSGNVYLSFNCPSDTSLERITSGFDCNSCSPGEFSLAGRALHGPCSKCSEVPGLQLPVSAAWSDTGCTWTCNAGYFGKDCSHCFHHQLNNVQPYNVSQCTIGRSPSSLCIEWSLRAESPVVGPFNTSCEIPGHGQLQSFHFVQANQTSEPPRRFRSVLNNLQPGTRYTVVITTQSGLCTGVPTFKGKFQTEQPSPCAFNLVTGKECSGVGTCNRNNGTCNCPLNNEVDNKIGYMGPACDMARGLAAQISFEVPKGVYGFDLSLLERHVLQALALDELQISGQTIGNRLAVRSLQASTGSAALGLALVVNFRDDEFAACSYEAVSDGTCFSSLLDIWNRGTGNLNTEADSLNLMRHIFRKSSAAYSLLVQYGMVELCVAIKDVPRISYPWMLQNPIQLSQWNAMGLISRLEVETNSNCENLSSCDECLISDACGWCSVSQSCMRASSNGPHPYLPQQCPQSALYHRKRTGLNSCPLTCSLMPDCDGCASRPECAWCDTKGKCGHLTADTCISSNSRKTIAQCPRGRCASITGPAECVADSYCAWCVSTNDACMELSSHQCLGKLSTSLRGALVSCELSAPDCTTCTSSKGCAWCPKSSTCTPSALVSPKPLDCPALNVATPWEQVPGVHLYGINSTLSSWGAFQAAQGVGAFPICFQEPTADCASHVSCKQCSSDAACAWCAPDSSAHSGAGSCMATATALHTCPQLAAPSSIYRESCPYVCYDNQNSFQVDGGAITTVKYTNPAEFKFGNTGSKTEMARATLGTVLTSAGVDKCVWRVDSSKDTQQTAALASGQFAIQFNIAVRNFIADSTTCLVLYELGADVTSAAAEVCPTVEGAKCYSQLSKSSHPLTVGELSSGTSGLSPIACDDSLQQFKVISSSQVLNMAWKESQRAGNGSQRPPALAAGILVEVSSVVVPLQEKDANKSDDLMAVAFIAIGATVFLAAVAVRRLQLRARNMPASEGDGGVSAQLKCQLPVFSIPRLVPSDWKVQLFKVDTAECSICFTDTDPGDSQQYRALSCGHIFHRECIDQWFDQHNTCPLCRSTMAASTSIRLPPWVTLTASDAPSRRVRIATRQEFINPHFDRVSLSQVGPPEHPSTASLPASALSTESRVEADTSSFEFVSPLYRGAARSR